MNAHMHMHKMKLTLSSNNLCGDYCIYCSLFKDSFAAKRSYFSLYMCILLYHDNAYNTQVGSVLVQCQIKW